MTCHREWQTGVGTGILHGEVKYGQANRNEMMDRVTNSAVPRFVSREAQESQLETGWYRPVDPDCLEPYGDALGGAAITGVHINRELPVHH